ncbi:sigma 54-interacting transcriptional regulator [Bacillus sp. PK3-056]|jgi:sigma-54 dependent transcriptional regulator, acetoin dehydrogenase operon transcriptional activator AcoR|uniref:sigma-54 interaction domain-containing protein n=2 Tax=Niallia TaxID=2837506 RepID=UPI000F4575C2|nr:sigma 54-interacting transcriptional regulator [Niallia circulans]AYV73210.1 sigma-54-dependent Fis family transcriptional regulator [Niallia circulans]UQZ75558.1 sigma-54-dependent Fis family transcriptional regulator [Niallia circulans]
MFTDSQMKIETSFTILSDNEKISTLTEVLADYSYVIIESEQLFTIGNEEQYLLAAVRNNQTIKDWLEVSNILPSEVIAVQDIKRENLSWLRPVIIKTQNEFQGIVTATARIQALQKENKYLATYFETLAETMNDAVTAVDSDGTVFYWNSVAEDTYQITKAAIIGKKIGEHFETDSIQLHRILKEGNPIRGTYHRPNEHTHVLINASPVLVDNKIIGGISTEHDITKLIHLNQELDSTTSIYVQKDEPFSSILSSSKEVKRAVEMAQKIASAEIPVLISGETGTGKEQLAQAIHYGGSKRKNQFLSLNCSTVPKDLVEMELFGYQKMTFNAGDPEEIEGKIEQAESGTLFIEEVDKMPLAVQEKLLHYMTERSFTRVGGEQQKKPATRLILSSTQPLGELVRKGEFNEKLYYQISVVHIEIPPLRNRKEDIPHLVNSFIKMYNEKYQKNIIKINEQAMHIVCSYDWPGNIKELKNVIEHSVLVCEGNRELTLEHIPAEIVEKYKVSIRGERGNREDNEMERIEEALKKTYGNKSAAATLLGISRGTLYNKIKEFGLK